MARMRRDQPFGIPSDLKSVIRDGSNWNVGAFLAYAMRHPEWVEWAEVLVHAKYDEGCLEEKLGTFLRTLNSGLGCIIADGCVDPDGILNAVAYAESKVVNGWYKRASDPRRATDAGRLLRYGRYLDSVLRAGRVTNRDLDLELQDNVAIPEDRALVGGILKSAKLNHNGKVNVNDFVLTLREWGVDIVTWRSVKVADRVRERMRYFAEPFARQECTSVASAASTALPPVVAPRPALVVVPQPTRSAVPPEPPLATVTLSDAEIVIYRMGLVALHELVTQRGWPCDRMTSSVLYRIAAKVLPDSQPSTVIRRMEVKGTYTLLAPGALRKPAVYALHEVNVVRSPKAKAVPHTMTEKDVLRILAREYGIAKTLAWDANLVKGVAVDMLRPSRYVAGKGLPDFTGLSIETAPAAAVKTSPVTVVKAPQMSPPHVTDDAAPMALLVTIVDAAFAPLRKEIATLGSAVETLRGASSARKVNQHS